MDKITIKCKNYGSLLSFSQRDKEGWMTEIIGLGITAKIKTSDYLYDPCSFFSDIASHWRGWDGIKEYKSLEGELTIQAQHDKKGEVSMNVTLTPNDRADDWKVEHTFGVEPGQLDKIALEMKEFFCR